jgi:outer membrane protein assembly factor BamB
MRKIYLSLIAVPMLSGCESWFLDKKILEGTRESIFAVEQNKKKSSIITISLDDPIEANQMENVGGNSNRLMQHATLGQNLMLTKSIDLDVSNGREILCPPIVINDQILILDNTSTLKSYDFNSGNKVFELPLMSKDRLDTQASFGGGIAHLEGVLYIATSLGELVAVSMATKEILWRKSTFGICRGAPVVDKDIICVVSENNRTTAYQTKTGQQIWSHEGIPESACVATGSSPASNGSVVLSPYSSGELVALKSHNGAVVWSRTLGGSKGALAKIFSHITANPVIKGDFVYAGSLNNQFSKIALKEGDSIWDTSISAMGFPLISGNAVFLTTSKRTMVAITNQTGDIVWETQLPATNPDLFDKPTYWSPPALGNGKLYVAGTTKELFVLDALTGKIIEKIELPDVVVLQPIIVKNTLMLLTHEGKLLMYK